MSVQPPKKLTKEEQKKLALLGVGVVGAAIAGYFIYGKMKGTNGGYELFPESTGADLFGGGGGYTMGDLPVDYQPYPEPGDSNPSPLPQSPSYPSQLGFSMPDFPGWPDFPVPPEVSPVVTPPEDDAGLTPYTTPAPQNAPSPYSSIVQAFKSVAEILPFGPVGLPLGVTRYPTELGMKTAKAVQSAVSSMPTAVQSVLAPILYPVKHISDVIYPFLKSKPFSSLSIPTFTFHTPGTKADELRYQTKGDLQLGAAFGAKNVSAILQRATTSHARY